jgi:cell migration-inducing and hyaluronan-binding protein
LLWSDADNWPNQIVPEEGDSVEILAEWKMLLDIEDPPKYHTIHVNGVLKFSDEIDIHLQAVNIWVKDGELLIGNETHPHQHNAQITLLDDWA